MSGQAFERQVAAILAKASARIWSWHPPEPLGQQNRVPGDFLFGHRRGWGILEVKETELATLPARQWETHQRATAARVEAQGGCYWLLVRFARGDCLFRWAELQQPIAPAPIHVGHPSALRVRALDTLVDLLVS
jgi:hypothetical protein